MDYVKETKYGPVIDPIFFWEASTFYTPLQAMEDGMKGKEPPLRVQVARCDSREVKRIFIESRTKFSGDILKYFRQEFVRLCKEDGLI